MRHIKLFEQFLNEEDTYNDYPAAAKKNAQKAIDWKEKYGRDEVAAGTAVGWARAHQLAKGENLSADTVGRMSAFNRHRKNSSISTEHKDTPWKDKGYVAWLIWGGDEGVDWATKKMEEIKESLLEANLEKRISAGLAIICNGKVLLAHTSGRKANTGWGIPKGGIEDGESKIDAAIRETYEEIGVKVPSNLINKNEHTFIVTSRQKKYTKVVSYFIVNIDDIKQIGLKKPVISKSKLQLEEIDGAEFMDAAHAKKGIMFSQYPILNVLQSNGLM